MEIKIPQDDFIRELLPEFVDTWIEDIDDKYGKFIEQKDSSELYRLAHTLKGSCYQFGLAGIAEMGVEIMGYAKDNEWQKAAEMEPRLKAAFEKVKLYLHEEGIK